MELSELSEEQVYDRLRERYQVMVCERAKGTLPAAEDGAGAD